MTRDEAINRATQLSSWGCFPNMDVIGAHVDLLAALGVLKLDEPMTDEDKACRVLNGAIGAASVDIVRSHLRGAGFKIVKA